ncbi:hypothetical protein psyc5s11_11140 [Clostridium gelidum]|uniref:Uncharacterized protein n=1 Tax=Clostridium gelidum TaxID=704125 RepID=A0ABM7SZL6_9CLOT|nr:DPP IV N-terminal domain-containing protein [Clostridium gelidum]BCZ45047.1 hypothetical protein psyc5s11_11140 [Clostridium gelidum]
MKNSIEGQSGLYIYDVDNKKFHNVISHGSSIWVSPDKTKVIYTQGEVENNKKQLNLYAAKINGNSLTSKICIYKDIHFSGSTNISGAINNAVQWSGDSKKILFFSGNDENLENNFMFMDKNEVNIITFK